MSGFLWNRLKYILTPQFDVYRKLADRVNGNVLDAGCGTGLGSVILTHRAHSVTSIEPDESAFGFAQDVFGLVHGVSFANLSINGAADNADWIKYFDTIVAVDVIEHIQEDGAAIVNLRRMLQPGGTLYVSTPNRLARWRKSAEHVREYSRDELYKLMAQYFGPDNVQILNIHFEAASPFDSPLIGFATR